VRRYVVRTSVVRRYGRLAAMALIISLVAAGCGDSKDSKDEAGGSAASTTTTTAPPQPAEVAVTATDFAFQLPPAVPSGVVKFTLTNSGKEAHDFQLLKIDGTHTHAEIKQIFDTDGGPTPEWLHGAGGVGTVGPGAPPGVAFVKIEAGATYVYVCTEDDAKTKKSHIDLGMIGDMKVEGSSPAYDLPKADATIVAKEYSFDIQGIKAGEQTVDFSNAGPAEVHIVVAAPLLPGKTLDDVKKYVSSQNPSGPPPLDLTKGLAGEALDPGLHLVLKANLAPGDYVALCFVSDRKGGPPHVAKGMITPFKVA